MSKLQELIETLCPNGVEYFNVKELTKKKTIKTITPSIKIKRNDYQENGITPIISQELEYISGYCDFTDNSIPKNNYVCFGDHSEHIKFVDFAFVQGADGLKIMSLDEEKLMAKFFYYAISSFYVRHNNYERHFKYLNETEIPVPPLEVQREIVRILDSFTLLTAELTAELIARKKQYEYYRDMLLTFDVRGGATSDVLWRTLGEICDVRDGTHDSPKPSLTGKYLITSKNVKNGTIDCTGAYLISDKDYEQINVRSKVDTWDILFTMIGTIGEIGMVAHEPDFAIKNVGLIKTGNELFSRFLRHYLVSDKVKAYIDANRSKGTQAFLALGKLRELPVPVVSEPVMKNLVQVLDNFDAICSDLNIGLPAEIEARQKQYEFYREKLLTFKQL